MTLWETLMGRAMTRAEKKARARRRRSTRRHLVHAAGCTEPDCAARDALDLIAEDASELGVRLPRSLRHLATPAGRSAHVHALIHRYAR